MVHLHASVYRKAAMSAKTVPDLGGLRLTIEPGKANRVTILAPKAGTYEFHCDLFCGDGHEGMMGTIIAED